MTFHDSFVTRASATLSPFVALPPELDSAFAAYNLPREISQMNLVFYAFAAFSIVSIFIDTRAGIYEFIPLNAFFLILAVIGVTLTRRIADSGLLAGLTHGVCILVVGALLLAKTANEPTDWFMYFADTMIITVITLALPVGMLSKVLYCSVLIASNGYLVVLAEFDDSTAMAVMLILVTAMVFSQIVYFKMQQAHFSAFIALRDAQRANEELRSATLKIDTLQSLLPICASCKKVRDQSGQWAQIDEYIKNNSDIDVSHGICPDCFGDLYPDIENQESS